MRRLSPSILLALALLFAWAGRAWAAEPAVKEELWGRTVLKIEIDVPPWMSSKGIKRGCKIKVNKSLSRWRARSTMRRIHLLGNVENIIIKAEPTGDDGVNVTIKVYPRYVIRDIEVKGIHALNYAEIVDDILHLSSGDDFHSVDLPQYKKNILDRYRELGHLQATVDIRVEKTKRKIDAAADLTFLIKEGPAYRVEKIHIVGDPGPFSRRKILKKLGWRENMKYDGDKVESGIRRLRKYLKGREHYEARVSDVALDDPETVLIHDERFRLEITVRVEVGPRIQMEYDPECFTCAQKKWKLDDHLGVENNRRFTKWIIEPYREKIETYFKARGHLDAVVTGELLEERGEDGQPVKRLIFTLDQGRVYKIEEIDFKNNPSFTDKELKKSLEAGKFFIREDFDKNLDNIIAFYNERGFLRAKILQKNADIDEGSGEITIVVVLEEGPRAIVEKVELSGNRILPDKKFQNMLKQADLVVGRPFNPFGVTSTKIRMIGKYLGRGYIKAAIREEVNISEDGKRAEVLYHFEEGRQYFFGNVYVHGNKLTKKHVILRELFITKNDPFNYDDVFASQQQLMKLGFFSTVDISPVNPDIDEETIDLLVTVDERNSGYVEGGVGYDTYSGYQGAFELGHKNLAGHGRKISFRSDVYFRDENIIFDQRTIAMNFVWPWIARIPMDGDLTIRDDQRHQIGYDLRQLSSIAALRVDFPKFFYRIKATRHNEAVRWAAKHWSGRLTFDYSRDFLFNIDESVEGEEIGEVTVVTISPQLTRDSRDNVFDPVSGKVYMGMLEWASPPLLSEINYFKAVGQISWFEPVFRWWKAKRGPVLALNFKVGHAQELRATDTIPINRRFYLGGSTTIRGFGQDQISPTSEDGSTPIGGYFFGYSNVEIRTPVGESKIGLLAFFDAGDVTDQVKEFYIDKLRTAAGMGVRYLTPVGPISFDYGVKLNREPDESFGEFYFTIGNAF